MFRSQSVNTSCIDGSHQIIIHFILRIFAIVRIGKPQSRCIFLRTHRMAHHSKLFRYIAVNWCRMMSSFILSKYRREKMKRRENCVDSNKSICCVIEFILVHLHLPNDTYRPVQLNMFQFDGLSNRNYVHSLCHLPPRSHHPSISMSLWWCELV